MSKISCKFFKFKNIKNLSELESKVLNKNYEEYLKIAKADQEQEKLMSKEEKTFKFSWDELSDQREIDFYDENKKNIKYMYAYANIEYPKRRKKDINGRILPKKDRVNDIQVLTVFICINKSIYFAICTSNETHVQRVKKLIGLKEIVKVDNQYKMPSDLFNWLFYQYTQKKGSLDTTLDLVNISGFIGNIGDEHNVFTGTSAQTSELIITKAFISNGETLKNVTARIKDEYVDIIFTIDDVSNTQILLNQSMNKKLLEAERDDIFFIVYLYGQLIPRLKELFNKESEHFLNQEKSRFSEMIGLEVIASIIEQNNLSIGDVSELFNETAECIEKRIGTV